MANPVTDVLWWINSEVDKLSGSGLASVHSALDAAQKELSADLAQAKFLQKDERYTAQMHRNALVQIQGAMEHIREEVAPTLQSTMISNGQAAGVMATNHLRQEVEQFSSIFEGTIRPIAVNAASVIAQGNKTLWPRYRSSASRYAGQVGKDIRQQLAIGMIRGETVDQMTTRLAKLGGPKGLVYTRGIQGDPHATAEVISEGLFKRYRYWAERIVRTEVVNAYNENALIGMDELEDFDPGYLKRWDAAVDGRLCSLCRAFDDITVPLRGKFPSGFDKPPRHPNCRCAVVVWRKEWNEADVGDNLAGDVKSPKQGLIAGVPHKFEVPDEKETRPSRERPPRRSRPELNQEREAKVAAREQARLEREAERNQRFSQRLEYQRIRQDKRAQVQQAAADMQQRERAKTDTVRRDLSSLRRQGEAKDADFAQLASKYRISEKFVRDLYQKDTEFLLRVERQRLKDQEAEKKKEERELRKQVRKINPEDKDNIVAIEKMKKTAMASTFHKSMEMMEEISDSDKEKFLAKIKELTGKNISIEEMSHAFAPPPGFVGKISGLKYRLQGATFEVDFYDQKTGAHAARLQRDFSPKAEIHHSYFVLKPGFQGAGFSDTVNGQAMLRYEKWGIEKMSVDAAWVGRYAWARMGFNFDEYELEKVAKVINRFIRKNVPASKQADYIAKAKFLVKEPWKLAKWDEGDKFKIKFNANLDDVKMQEGEYAIGKALLLHNKMQMWSGAMDVKSSNPGYLNALRLMQVSTRK